MIVNGDLLILNEMAMGRQRKALKFQLEMEITQRKSEPRTNKLQFYSKNQQTFLPDKATTISLQRKNLSNLYNYTTTVFSNPL